MDNPWDAVRGAVQEARSLDRALDQYANTMADVLAGRLRKVDAGYLLRLKRELRDFNAHTGSWKD